MENLGRLFVAIIVLAFAINECNAQTVTNTIDAEFAIQKPLEPILKLSKDVSITKEGLIIGKVAIMPERRRFRDDRINVLTIKIKI